MKTRFLRDKEGKIDERYTIAEDGSYIRNKKTGKKKFPYINSRGYKVVSIKINGNYYKQIKICHLQWLAWKGIIPKGYEIHHKEWSKDKKIKAKLKLNDHINNLDCMIEFKHKSLHNSGESNCMYGRTEEKSPMSGKHLSEKHKKKIGINQRGEKNHNAKITFSEKEEILYLYYACKWSQKKIAKRFNVSCNGCVQRIISGTRWNYDKLSKEELKVKYSH